MTTAPLADEASTTAGAVMVTDRRHRSPTMMFAVFVVVAPSLSVAIGGDRVVAGVVQARRSTISGLICRPGMEASPVPPVDNGGDIVQARIAEQQAYVDGSPCWATSACGERLSVGGRLFTETAKTATASPPNGP